MESTREEGLLGGLEKTETGRAASQEILEKRLQKILEQLNKQEDEISGMIQATYVGCSHAQKSVTLAYPMMAWEANRINIIHGGILTTCMDNAMVVLQIALEGIFYLPTISMDIKFLRSIESGDRLLITAEEVKPGRRVSHIQAIGRSEKTGKQIVSATAVFAGLE